MTDRSHKIYTPEEDASLKELYYKKKYHVKGIARIMNRSVDSINKRIGQLRRKTHDPRPSF